MPEPIYTTINVPGVPGALSVSRDPYGDTYVAMALASSTPDADGVWAPALVLRVKEPGYTSIVLVQHDADDIVLYYTQSRIVSNMVHKVLDRLRRQFPEALDQPDR
jgi:hypothetical protein